MKRTSLFLFLGLCVAVSPSMAAVIYETDYTTRSDNGNPFNDGGELRFQDGWLGTGAHRHH